MSALAPSFLVKYRFISTPTLLAFASLLFLFFIFFFNGIHKGHPARSPHSYFVYFSTFAALPSFLRTFYMFLFSFSPVSCPHVHVLSSPFHPMSVQFHPSAPSHEAAARRGGHFGRFGGRRAL